MDFVTSLSISADWKGDSYDSILVIVDRLTKMVHYEPGKVTIDAPDLAEVIIDVRDCTPPWSSGVNRDGSRLAFHIQILVLAILLFGDQKEAIHSLPPSNKWPDREAEQHNGSVPQSICQRGAR